MRLGRGLLGLCLFFVLPVKAIDVLPDSVSLAYGQDLNEGVVMDDIRLGLRWQWNHDLLKLDNWIVTGYIDAALSKLKSHADQGKVLVKHLPGKDQTRVYSLAPVFRFEPKRTLEDNGFRPYFDIGVGGAWFEHYNLEREGNTRQKLGDHTQFEIRLGAGVRFGPNQDVEAGYQYIHYSNAMLHGTNMGLDMHMISLAYWFR